MIKANLGTILYQHYIEGISSNDLSRKYSLPFNTIQSLVSGKYNPDAFNVFFEMLETQPKKLDKLFKVGASNG